MTGQIHTNLKGYSRGTLEMVITRADGTVEDLGIVAESVFPTNPTPEPRSLLRRFGDWLCRSR